MAASIAAGAFAEDAEPVCVVTVEPGVTNRLDECEVSVTQDGVTETKEFSSLSLVSGTFKKRGFGFLMSSTAMTNFTGTILIEEGALMTESPGMTGPADATAGPMVISNGASLVLAPSAGTCENYALNVWNEITLSGTGINGMGAVYGATRGPRTRDTFKGSWHLSGDATVNGEPAATYDYGDKAGGFYGYHLNGHTLTFAYGKGCVVNGGKFDPGHILIPDGGMMYVQSGLTLYGGDTNTLTVAGGGRFSTYNGNAFNAPWKMILEDGSYVYVNGSVKESWARPADRINWAGPIDVQGAVTVRAGSAGGTDAFSALGPVSGDGGFDVTRGFLHLSSASNSFKGPLSVSATTKVCLAGVGFHADGAWPKDNATTFTNKNGCVYLTANDVRLPAIDYTTDTGYSNTTFFGDGGAIAASLVKRGAGALEFTAPVAVTGRTDFLEGTIRIPPPNAAVAAMHSSAPGLWEGIMDYGDDSVTWTADKTSYYTDGTAAVTNGVQDSPYMAYQYGSPWTMRMFVRYQGYIWNRTETAGNWSFALALAGGGKLLIDGVKVLENLSSNWYFLWTNTVSITPGPHTFDLRLYNSGYGDGGCRQTRQYWWGDSAWRDLPDYDTWANYMGFAYDPNGCGLASNTAFNSANYLKAQNEASVRGVVGGDGHLFTRDARTQAECFDEIEKIARASFAELAARPGTVLDLGGSALPLRVPALQGFTTVTNGSLTIGETWRLTGADLDTADNTTLRVDGRLAFAAGAKIVLEDAADFCEFFRGKGGFVLASAKDGIEGVPAFEKDGEDPYAGHWHLLVKSDELVLEHFSGMMILVR